jgi:hypothetical protein
MTWLNTPGAFERQINRSPLHYRSTQLDALVAAMKVAEQLPGDRELYTVGVNLNKWKKSDPNEFGKRFGPERYAELMAELLQRRKNLRFGIPVVVDPESHPVYDPELWNDSGVIQTSTNCYAYACNDRVGHRPAEFNARGKLTALHTPQPGHMGQRIGLSGTALPTGSAAARQRAGAAAVEFEKQEGYAPFTGPGVRYNVMQDNWGRKAQLTPFLLSRGQDPINVPGSYLIALVVHGEDYHWLRQDADSYWSHKPGISRAIDTDDAGDLIDDPRFARFVNIPYRFECFYQVPAGGVKTWSLGDQF